MSLTQRVVTLLVLAAVTLSAPAQTKARPSLGDRTAFEVEVRDRDGKPVEAFPIIAVVRSNGRPVTAVWSDDWICVRAITDEKGTATLDLRLTLQQLGASVDKPGKLEVVVLPEILQPDPKLVVLPYQNLPADPVKIEAPRTGRLVVRMGDVAAFTEPMKTVIQRAERERTVGTLPPPRLLGALHRKGRARDVVFPHIAIGQRIRAVRHAQGRADWCSACGPGPAKAGETALITVRRRPEHWTLSGRLVTADGQPVADTTVSIRTVPRPDTLPWFVEALAETGVPLVPPAARSRTDRNGRFRVMVDYGAIPPIARVEVTIHAETRGGARGGHAARVYLSGTPEPTTVEDLGDVVVRDQPLVVAGRVVDRSGKPVHGATLVPHHRLLADFLGRDVRGIMDEPPGVTFSPALESTATTAQDGSFEIRSLSPGEKTCFVAARGFARAQITTTTLRKTPMVTLDRSVSVSGRLVLDSGIPPEHLAVRARGPTWRTHETRVDHEGRYFIEGIPRGRITVSALIGSHHFENLGTKELRPDNSNDGWPGRVDLRGRLHAFTISVRDTAGKPVVGARVTGGRPGPFGVAHDTREADETGRVQIVTSGRPYRLSVHGVGFVPHKQEGLSEDVTVTLKPGRWISVRFDLGTYRPPTGMTSLRAVATHEDGPRMSTPAADRSASKVFRDGTVDLMVDGPGIYRIRLFFGFLRGSGVAYEEIDLVGPDTVEIGEKDMVVERTFKSRMSDIRKALETVLR